MTNTMAVDDVLPRLAEAAARSAHSDRGEVRVLLADGRQQRQIWPPGAPDAGDLATVAVRHRGATVGRLGVETADAVIPSGARRLLDELAGPAGLALTSVRLTVELRRRLDEVERLTEALEASQARLIAARRLEQQRIRAQAERRLVPHLDDLARHLACAENRAADAGPGASATAAAELQECLAAAREAATEALEALRSLSRRVFSPVLFDSGIKAALRAWADQSGVALAVQDQGDMAALHDRPVVESALVSQLRRRAGAHAGLDRVRPRRRRRSIGEPAVACGAGRARGHRDRAAAADRPGRGPRRLGAGGPGRGCDPDLGAVGAGDDLRPGPGIVTLRLVLAEDNFLVREGIRRLLDGEEDLEVVETCEDLPSLLDAVERVQPDVVLTDIRMPPTRVDEGVQASEHCRRTYPGMGVILLSQYAEPAYVRVLLSQGAEGRGYLLKERVADVKDMTDAIRLVAGGGSAIDPKVVETLVRVRAGGDGDLSHLTAREREVLGAMAQGKNNAAIAELLVVSQRAVEKHINSIFAKLGITGDTQGHPRVRAVLVYLAGIGD